MPVLLLIAFAASLGAHALVLFAPDIDLSFAGEPPALMAELKTLPAPPMAKAEAKTLPAARRPAKRKAAAVTPRPLPTTASSFAPDTEAIPDPAVADAPHGERAEAAAPDESAATASTPTAASLPARGTIHYRVDRGDQGFEIGFAIHDWEVKDGAYRITAVTETSGLIGIFRPLRFEVESRGRLTASGLLPELVLTRQRGRATDERAELDWESMELRVHNRPVQALRPGTQDLLSFPYQLGLIADHGAGSSLPIVTGKKYADHRVEVVGDEQVMVPAGTFRSLHLRVPGIATTELWLAYDHALLPVKVQHLDRKGDLYIQVATALELSQEAQ